MSKVPYTGPKLDANTLKSGGNWITPQAMWDAANVAYSMPLKAFSAAIENDADQNPRIPNVQDNAEVQAAGWADGSFEDAHPASPYTQSVIEAANEWAKSTAPGHHHGANPG